LSLPTVRNFEKGGETRDSNRILIRMALEEAGIEFIPANGGGMGLRFRA
jgi:hypothetical protein